MSYVYKLPTGFLELAIVFKILPLNSFTTSMVTEFDFSAMLRNQICKFVNL